VVANSFSDLSPLSQSPLAIAELACEEVSGPAGIPQVALDRGAETPLVVVAAAYPDRGEADLRVWESSSLSVDRLL
jgi:hypothetical protein